MNSPQAAAHAVGGPDGAGQQQHMLAVHVQLLCATPGLDVAELPPAVAVRSEGLSLAASSALRRQHSGLCSLPPMRAGKTHTCSSSASAACLAESSAAASMLMRASTCMSCLLMASMAFWASLLACWLLCRSSCKAKEKQESRIFCKDQNAGTQQGSTTLRTLLCSTRWRLWRQGAAACCLTGHTQCRYKTLAEH